MSLNEQLILSPIPTLHRDPEPQKPPKTHTPPRHSHSNRRSAQTLGLLKLGHGGLLDGGIRQQLNAPSIRKDFEANPNIMQHSRI